MSINTVNSAVNRQPEDSNHLSGIPHHTYHDSSTRSLSGNVDYRADSGNSSSGSNSTAAYKSTNGTHDKLQESTDKMLIGPEIAGRRASVHQKVSIFEHYVFKDVIGT
jgi:hypothetical protein